MNVPMMIENKVTNSLRGSVLNLLNRDYQFIVGEKIQDMFAQDIVDLVDTCYKEPWKLDVGQILWYGAAVENKNSKIRSKCDIQDEMTCILDKIQCTITRKIINIHFGFGLPIKQ